MNQSYKLGHSFIVDVKYEDSTKKRFCFLRTEEMYYNSPDDKVVKVKYFEGDNRIPEKVVELWWKTDSPSKEDWDSHDIQNLTEKELKKLFKVSDIKYEKS